MGLFGKKKICSICGGEIKLLGNRKLEDGNMCKTCAKKLSPWFSDRRKSTVDEIKAQLEYREKNQAEVEKFRATSVIGQRYKVMLDEDNGKFMVATSRDYVSENPDVIDFKDVTGVEIDIDEDRDEITREDSEGRSVSYNPPRYDYSYDFNVIIRVNNPYFDEIRFRLNDSTVHLNYNTYSSGQNININIGGFSIGGNNNSYGNKPDPHQSVDYCEYEKMCNDIRTALTSARKQAREQVAAANAPRVPVVCQCCGATTTPDLNGCCEFCGGKAQG